MYIYIYVFCHQRDLAVAGLQRNAGRKAAVEKGNSVLDSIENLLTEIGEGVSHMGTMGKPQENGDFMVINGD